MKVSKYSPQSLFYPSNNPKYFEIRWNLSDCILDCEFCWNHPIRSQKLERNTIEKMPSEVFNDTANNIENPNKTCISFTGGEPTLCWKELLEIFEKISKDEELTKIPILIRTNGISIGKTSQ